MSDRGPTAHPVTRLADDELSAAALRLRRARRRRAEERRRALVAGAVVAAVVLVAAGLALALRGGEGDAVEAVGTGSVATDPTTTGEPDDPTAGGVSTTTAAAGETEPVAPASTAPPPEAGATCSTASWTQRARISSLVFASLGSDDAGQVRALVDAGVGGVFVSSASVGLLEADALRPALEGAAIPPLVAIDEEGGRVQRVDHLLGDMPSARAMGAMTAEEVRTIARERGERLLDLGVNTDFAPVVDVTDATEGVIGDRSFSGDPEGVVAGAGAFADGLVEAGLRPTFKHFPGHGRASGDSHDGVVSTPSLAELGPDLDPYEALLPSHPTALVMLGHLVVPGLTQDGVPATISPEAVQLLRGEMGFAGVIVTDDLGNMAGILDVMSTTAAAATAVAAGVDMVLVPADQVTGTIDAIEAAVGAGTVTDEQVTAAADRVLRSRLSATCA